MLRTIVSGCFVALLLAGTGLADKPSASWLAVQIETARHGYLNARLVHQTQRGDVNEVFIWSRRLRDAELSAATDIGARIAACKEHLERIDAARPYVDLGGRRLDKGIELDHEYHDGERMLAQFDPHFKQALQAKMAVLEKLQGRWRAVQFERSGKPGERPEAEVFDIRGGMVHKRSEHRTGTITATAYIALNVEKEPMEIDLVGLNDDLAYVASGIVAVDGDRMRICLSHDREDRPTRFVSGRRDPYELFLLERVEREKAPEEP